MGPFVPFAVSRLCRERRATLGMEGDLVVAAPYSFLMDEKPLVFAGVHTRPISA